MSLRTQFSALEWLAIAVAVLGWGANFVAIRWAVSEIPVWTALSLRFLLVGLVLLPFIRWPKGQGRRLMLISVILVPGHFGLLFWASEITESMSAVALFVQLGAVFSVLLAWWLLKEPPGAQRLLGLLLAFSAMGVLFYEPNLMQSRNALGITLLSALCIGLYTVLLRWPGTPAINPFAVVGWSSLLGVPWLMVIATLLEHDQWQSLPQAGLSAWTGLAYTALVSSVLSHGAWAWLCQRHPLSQITPFVLITPIIAVFTSVLAFDESLSMRLFISAAILIIGLAIVFMAKPISPTNRH